MGLFSKLRSKRQQDENALFSDGSVLTPEEFARAGEAASAPAALIEPAPAPAPTQIAVMPAADVATAVIPAVSAPEADSDEVPRGKHARGAESHGAHAAASTGSAAKMSLPEIDSASANAGEHAPAHAADTVILPAAQIAAGQEPASFEDTFFAANEFDMSAEPKRKGAKRAAKIAGISLAAVLVVAYGVGVGVFTGHFYPNTTGEGIDLSMMTVEEASTALEANAVDYSITIDGKDMELTIPGDQIDFFFSGENVAAKMHETVNPWLWPYQVFLNHDTSDSYSTEFDASKLASILEEAIAAHNESATPTEDAHLGYLENTKQIGVVPEAYGTELVPRKVIDKVTDAVNRAHRKVTLDNEDVVAPTVLSTDQGLNKAAANAQKISHADLKLTINGEEVAEINAKQYVEWLNVAEDYSVTLDQEKMNAWIEDFCAGFNTVGSERTYTRPDGKVITVSGGDYGWEVDTDSLQATVQEAVANNTVGTVEVPVWQTAQVFTAAGEQDWGSRYVDVDMSEQYVRFYDGGEIIWESDCITGAGYDPGRATPQGVYTVKNKTTNEPLRPYENGRQVEEPTYVSYWMPFVGNMIGLHDAWWQPYFGGSAYMDGLGSHGCVNLPSYKAEELFYIIEIGDVVITHY